MPGSLHIPLMPQHFLPALDLLDRGLVTKCIRPNSYAPVYYVRSQNPVNATSTSSTYSSSRNHLYEVRPHAWNCTCVSFAFATYASLYQDVDNDNGIYKNDDPEKMLSERLDWQWGGCSNDNGHAPLICKHLIACVIAERCPGAINGAVIERHATAEELAELSVLWD